MVPMIVAVALASVPVGFRQAEPPGGQDVARTAKSSSRAWVQNISYRGTVTAVDRFSITIMRPGDKEAREFLIVKELSEATVAPPGSRHCDTNYLPSDVRVGDLVTINYCEDGADKVCYEICILRRPGGRVPPGYARNLDSVSFRHHECMNAHQDLEEKGIPLPPKYDPKEIMRLLDGGPAPEKITPPRIPPAKP